MRLNCKKASSLFNSYEIFGLGVTKGHRRYLKQLLQGLGGFGWLAVTDDKPETLIEAGRIYFKIWLQLAAWGYCFQPVSAATLTSFTFQFNKLPPDWVPTLSSMHEKFISEFTVHSQLEKKWIPLWGFRTGLPINQKKPERTLRRSLTQLLTE